jgi:cytochrome c
MNNRPVQYGGNMRKFILALTMLAAGLFADAAQAADETALATSKGCMACHQVGVKVVGPAYKDVAKRYTGYSSKDYDRLVKKVLDGGSGTWGTVPMPANKASGLTEAEAKRLVNWILSFR